MSIRHLNYDDEQLIDISTFKGKVFSRIERIVIPSKICDYDADAIIFIESTGDRYLMFKKRDCCCTGEIKDIVGDLKDLINVPILGSECVTKHKKPAEYDSQTWTFYKFKTINGYVDITWFSGSNGYYSEEVSLELVQPSMAIHPYVIDPSLNSYSYLMNI